MGLHVVKSLDNAKVAVMFAAAIADKTSMGHLESFEPKEINENLDGERSYHVRMCKTKESRQILRTVVAEVRIVVNMEQRPGDIERSASKFGTVEWDKAFGHWV